MGMIEEMSKPEFLDYDYESVLFKILQSSISNADLLANLQNKSASEDLIKNCAGLLVYKHFNEFSAAMSGALDMGKQNYFAYAWRYLVQNIQENENAHVVFPIIFPFISDLENITRDELSDLGDEDKQSAPISLFRFLNLY